MQPDKERIAAAAAIIASRCSPNWREFDNAEWIARAVLTESDRVAGKELVTWIEGAETRLCFVIVPSVAVEGQD